MIPIVDTITSQNIDTVISWISELKNPSIDVLESVLGRCKSEEVASLVRFEFSRLFGIQTNGHEASQNVQNIVQTEISPQPMKQSCEEATNTQSIQDAIKKFTFGNSKHDKALEMFINAFKHCIEDVDCDKAGRISKEIVQEIIKRFASTFPKEVRTKSHNLKENTALCKNVYTSKVDVEEFVKMSPSQMQSEELKSKDSEYIKESILASQIASATADTDMFQCSKCKERKCTYSQLQTRSCDEPMTTFVTCTVCGHRWKF